ncbi:S26 family signal peptidase [Haemophilus paracuniculus]|uniref:Signal peptidase I n=1 Tax=Haemophilus paracuniculus TaxID=734 RepID=A0A1T0AQY7_9PAST|nr:signal peptidase I [Haemophilus paracuniculus]OOR98580.1 S26 family signal peptidase [Haemophilus paracuniculus]
MGNLISILFIGVLYGIWKWLDSMQLPNSISILLVSLVAICGICWVLVKRGRKNGVTEFFGSLFGVLFVITMIRSFLFEPFQIPSGSMEPTLRVGDFLLVNKFGYGIKDPIFQNTLIEVGKPQRGDIIVFKAPKQPNVDYIKRVVGVGGDRIKYDMRTRELTLIEGDSGKKVVFKYEGGTPNPDFYYHGEMQIERTEIGSVSHQILNNPQPFNYAPYFFKQEGLEAGEWIVPAGQYFVMGDNRDNSEDSRFWGFVPEKNVVGKASYIWLSLDKKPNEYPTGVRFSRMFTAIQ